MNQTPVPTPNTGEKQNDFISRCMSTLSDTDPDRPQDQRLAMCFNAWRSREGVGDMHPHFARILALFRSRHGENEGLKRFWTFIQNNALSVLKPYDPNVQFTERFEWVKPHIAFFKSDKNAKYYLISCIHAIVSMNKRDYTDYDKMTSAAPSMNYRPVNINHDHSRWVPYPRTRLDFAKAEDNTVEGILRVDNQDKNLQLQLDHDPSIPEKEWIYHPSIEGRPMLGGMEKEGYHFTGLALLEKGYQLPGDPLSEISPLMVESVSSGETCLVIDGEQLCFSCDDNGDDKMDEKIVTEAEGPINPEGAICPACGHKITPDPTVEAQYIKCPRCDTQMVRLPEKTYEALKDLSDEDALTYARENLSEVSELFRPPFPFTPARQFKKTTGADLKKADIPDVGIVDGATIGIVEHQEALAKKDKKIADITSEVVALEKRVASNVAKMSEMQADYDSALAKLADKTREASRVDEFKGKTGELMEEIVKLENELKELNATNEQLERINQAKDIRYTRLEKELQETRADVSKLKVELDEARNERNDLSVKYRGSEEKALNETRERSRIQMDNANLLDDKRKLTAEISDLSEQIANCAKNALEKEKEVSKLREQLQTKEAEYKAKFAELHETINQAKKFHKWAWDKLKEAGYSVAET